MHFFYRLIPSVVVVSMLVACAGRIARPVEREQSGDDKLTCAEMSSQVKGNEARIAGLEREKDGIRQRNTKKYIFSFLIVPLFFIESEDGPNAEILALEYRNAYLTKLFNQNCTLPEGHRLRP